MQATIFSFHISLQKDRKWSWYCDKECREACGGQGVKTENRIGQFKGEFDVHSTFEGDNNVLMQQISKALLAEYIACQTKNKPFRGLGLEHMNKSSPVIPSELTSSTIKSSEFQIDLFHLRERHLLKRFAEEVSEHQSNGNSKEYTIILSYQLAEGLGRAFSERAILKTFIEAESALPAGSLKDVLKFVKIVIRLDLCGRRRCLSPIWILVNRECFYSEERSTKTLC